MGQGQSSEFWLQFRPLEWMKHHVWSTSYRPDTVPRAFIDVIFVLTFLTFSRGKYYSSHFLDRRTETRSCITWPKQHYRSAAELGCVLSCFSPVQLSSGFSRQEYWNGLPFPTLWDLPGSGIESVGLVSPALAGRFFSTAPPGKPSL